MARPRGGTALFDLLGDDGIASRGSSQPDQGTRSDADRPSPPQRTAPTAAERPVVMGTRRLPHGSSTMDSGLDAPDSGRRPLFEVQDDSVRVNLTSVRTAVLVFLLCAVLIGAFEWGRRRGHQAGLIRGYDAGRESYAADTMTEIEAARQGSVAPGLVDDLTAGSPPVLSAYEQAVGRQTSLADGAVAWVPGHTYVVAQGFQPGRDADAEQAQAFLASRGIETVLVRFDSGAMQLITVQGFNRSDDAQRSLADQLLADVHRVGKDYFASGGSYRLEGYFATFRGDRW